MILKSERGSTLIIMIFVVSILEILGLATLAITMDNYEMKKLNSKSKVNFYIAEGGIEEAKLIIYQMEKDGINYSLDELKKYNNNSNVMDQEHYDNLNYIFKEKYKSYFLNNNKLINTIEDTSKYNIQEKGHLIIRCKIEDKEDHLNLKIVSSYTEDDVAKKLSINCKIEIPNYIDVLNGINISTDSIKFSKWKVTYE